MLLDEWERSGGSAAQFADYVGIRYSTFANWIQKRRKQAGLQASLLKPGAVDSSQRHGHWVEAIVEKNPEPKGLESSLRIYFTAGAYVRLVMPETMEVKVARIDCNLEQVVEDGDAGVAAHV
jgi:hypothetical protein